MKRTIAWKNGELFWCDLFDALGITPGAKVVGTDMKPIKGIRRGSFTNGKEGVLILACLSNLPEQEATLVLPRRYHVVDLRSEKYLGFQDKVPLTVGEGKAFAFSLLPSEPKGLKLIAPGIIKAGTAFTINAETDSTGQSTHVFRFVITGPDGKSCPWFSRRVITQSNKTAVKMVAAWNDMKGIYSIEAVDVASSLSATKTFELIP